MSSSWTTKRPRAREDSREAASTPPTPRVVALVGACRRMRQSGSRTRPIEPTSVKKPPTIRQNEIAASSSVASTSALRSAERGVPCERGGGDEADQRDEQRRLEVGEAVVANAEQDRDRVHVQRVEGQDAIRGARADDQAERGERERAGQRQEGEVQGEA